MHRPPPASRGVVAVFILGALTRLAFGAGANDPLAQARTLLSAGQASQAIAVLEDALPTLPKGAELPLLELLRGAYAAAAQEAEARGNASEAERYRDNLEILGRRPLPTPPPLEDARSMTPGEPILTPRGFAEAVAGDHVNRTEPEGREPAPVIVPPVLGAPDPVPLALPAPATSAERIHDRAEGPAQPAADPGALKAATADPVPAPASVSTADDAFRAGNYLEAGRIYAQLDREGRLPPARRDHWAYCRWVDVVRRINARPGSPQDWADIEAEIERIRALSPNNWYGEYLRNRAAERPSGKRAGRSNRTVVRGSAPEEPALRVAPSRPAAPAATPAPRAPKPASEAPKTSQRAAAGTGSGAGSGPGSWQVHETPSFRLFHNDPEVAEKAAEIAEAARDAQIRRWVGSAPKAPWTPKCDVYLYPTGRVFSQMTGQPEESPGFSTMGMNGGKIIARRVNLRVDHPNLLTAIMPHEITHVVLADLFPQQQIPRWADEGMAVLSEPAGEQHLRAADLVQPLTTGQLFKLEKLMTMDYPEGRYWGLYYAQSVSLTRFLVEQGTPTQFVQFVQRSQVNGAEAELRRIYNIDGFTDLHTRWINYARGKSTEMTASAAPAEPESPTTRR